MKNLVKRLGRNKFTMQYKKQKMLFTSDDINNIEQELKELGIIS